MAKTEETRGWGIRVGGPWPYLVWGLWPTKKEAEDERAEPYHRVVKCVLLPLAEYRRLKRLDKEE